MNTINNRYEFVYLFDVENGNPNGDPDAGNMPRLDPETNFGLVTDVCLKRKVRNFVEITKENKSPFEIYVREKAVLTTTQGRAHQAVAQQAQNDTDKIKLAREWMCSNFFDIRAFGAVMSLKEYNCGQVRGPVQLSFARSIEPIVPLEITITRMAVATEREAESQSGDNRTMGRKHIVPYALYRAHGFISAPLAKQTGFSEDDLELFWKALINMFDHDHSAARGQMNARKLIVFRHDSEIGNAPAHKLFDLIKIERANDSTMPARNFTDYRVEIDQHTGYDGVTIEEKI